MVGFSSSQQKCLDGFLENREPIQLTDCEVKKARRGEDMEVLLKSSTKITKSKRIFNIPEAEFKDNEVKDVLVAEIVEFKEYQKVNVNVQVLSVGEVKHVGLAGKRKQDVLIADKSGTCRLTLW